MKWCTSVLETPKKRGDLWVLVVTGGEVERRRVVVILRIHICPGLDEKREDLRVLVAAGGGVERR